MRLSAGSFPACFVVAEDWVPLSVSGSWDVSFTEGFGSKSFQRKGRNNIMQGAGEHRRLMHWEWGFGLPEYHLHCSREGASQALLLL